MNKLPAKQIYLLIIIIVGIFMLSVYSTYSLFTLESETSNVVSINTPNSIVLDTEVYEYKQIVIPKNSYITTDIDLYNNHPNDLCYGIWYKLVITDLVDQSKIKVYENTKSNLTTSGIIGELTSKRINLLIINDNDIDVNLNIGVTYEESNNSCSLNLNNGRELISMGINSPKILSDTLINDEEINENEEGYLVYKNNTDELKLTEDQKYYIATKFIYHEELFELINPEEIDFDDIEKYIPTENNSYYTCLSSNNCQKLYKINSIKSIDNEISIDKYDELVGYLNGNSGLRKVNDNYYYYGDNPHNFIYYNCKNDIDTSTCELWRIIGFYYDKTNQKYLTKIIKNSSIGSYSYSLHNNLWNDSMLATNLIEYINGSSENFITEVTYGQENIVTTDTGNTIITYIPDEYKSSVTLMNLSDYLNACICQKQNIVDYDSNCLKNNWLNNNENEFTMTIKYEIEVTDPETNEIITPDNNIVYSIGNSIKESLITEKLNIRPVVYLKSRTLFTSGDGSLDNPYIIK